MIRAMIAISATLLAVSSGKAADCSAITDAAARLACFDAAPKVAPKKAAAKKTAGADEFAAAKAAMSRKLTDPESARFTDLFKAGGGTPVVCGMVNSKNRMGGYAGNRGFVYLPAENLAVLMLNGVADPEPASYGLKVYCSSCATDPRADQEIRSYCH